MSKRCVAFMVFYILLLVGCCVFCNYFIFTLDDLAYWGAIFMLVGILISVFVGFVVGIIKYMNMD